MPVSLNDDEFGDVLRSIEHDAFRLELQRQYAEPEEAATVARFHAGDPEPPTEVAGLRAWFDQVAAQTAAGKRIERVRVHEDPPTPYQRWERWIDRWNVEAGETIHYMTRAHATRIGLLPAAGDRDWWLLDGTKLISMSFDDEGHRVLTELVDDPDAVARASAWRDLALRHSAWTQPSVRKHRESPPMTDRPDSQAIQLADDLRQLRLASGLANKTLAEKARWHPSKVSRIERGDQLPSTDDIVTWVRVTESPTDRIPALLALLDAVHDARRSEKLWKNRMRRGQAPVQVAYNELVQQSKLIRHFETAYVPGLLQTADYARRVLAEMIPLHGLTVDDVESAVAARMQRQALLYERSKRFEFLLAEPVLRWLLCPPDLMRAQIDRLQTVVGLPNVRFGILPMGIELCTTPQNSFQLYDDLACVETFIGETQHIGEEADRYARAIDRMWNEAVEGDDARALLVRAANGLAA